MCGLTIGKRRVCQSNDEPASKNAKIYSANTEKSNEPTKSLTDTNSTNEEPNTSLSKNNESPEAPIMVNESLTASARLPPQDKNPTTSSTEDKK